MPYKTLLLEKQDGVAILSLNQPEKRNAMSIELGQEFKAVLAELKADAEVRILMLTGKGPSFSSGGDLQSTFAQFEAPPMEAKDNIMQYYRTFLGIRDLPFPSIAVLKGHTIGAALCLALACDMRIASKDARMAMSFIKLGIHPGMGTTATR